MESGTESPGSTVHTSLFLLGLRSKILSIRKVYVDLYSAFSRKPSQMRSDMDHTVLPANYTMPAFTPSRRTSPPLAGTHFTVPRRVEG